MLIYVNTDSFEVEMIAVFLANDRILVRFYCHRHVFLVLRQEKVFRRKAMPFVGNPGFHFTRTTVAMPVIEPRPRTLPF